MNKAAFYLVTYLCIYLVSGQAGGGGSSSSSGGGSGGGFSGSTGSSSSESSQSCYTKCERKFAYSEIASCKQSCDFELLIIVVIVIIVVILVIIFLIFRSMYKWCRKICNYVLGNADNVNQPIQLIQNRQMQVMEHSPHYQVDLTQEEFQRERQLLLGAQWHFYYIQNGNKFDIKDYKFSMMQKSPNCYRITAQGYDKYGNWTFDGEYYNSNQTGVSLWMQKQYQNKQKAGQTGRWKTLIYEGKMNDIKNYVGKWYYTGFEKDPQYSGTWEMVRLGNKKNIYDNQ